MRNPLNTRLPLMWLLIISTVLAFSPVMLGGFVWDDSVYLLPIEAYNNLDLIHVLTHLGNGVEYQPVRDITYLIDIAIWKWLPFGFHLTNLILYLLTIYAVYLLAREIQQLFGTVLNDNQPEILSLPFLTAALFALHPIHVEPVAFITGGRNTLLATLFSILATRDFCGYLRRIDAGPRQVIIVVIWYTLALLSKATATTLPLFLLIVALNSRQRPLKARIAVTLPFFIMGGVAATVHAYFAAGAGFVTLTWANIPWISRLAIALQIPSFYLGKLIFPVALAADYGNIAAPDFFSTRGLTSAFVASSIIVIAVVGWRRARCLSPAAAWYGTTLIPVLSLLASPMMVADRYAFLPSFGFCLALAWIGSCFARHRPKIVLVCGISLLCMLSVLTFRQALSWRTERSLWEQTLTVNANSSHALQNIGTELFSQGAYDQAFALFDRARSIDSRATTFDFFSGLYAYTHGNYSSAKKYFSAALLKDPELMDALFYLAEVNLATKQPREAAEYYRRILSSRGVDRKDYRRQATERLQYLVDDRRN